MQISFDAKAKVKIGEFSRGGKNRVETKAIDHDYKAETQVTPIGILIPDTDDLSFYMSTSAHVTSDCLVDILEDWWENKRFIYPGIKKLVINMDNGPDQHSKRTQFMKRIQDFANQAGLIIQLAYYPPYHSKYNPVERTFGVLENYWMSELLDSIDAVCGFAKSMTWKGKHPVVKLFTKTYQLGVTLSKKAMTILEKNFERLVGLEKWFVKILP